MVLLHLRQNLLGLQPHSRDTGHQHRRHQQDAAHDSHQHEMLRGDDDILCRFAEQRPQGAGNLLAGKVGQREGHHRNQQLRIDMERIRIISTMLTAVMTTMRVVIRVLVSESALEIF